MSKVEIFSDGFDQLRCSMKSTRGTMCFRARLYRRQHRRNVRHDRQENGDVSATWVNADRPKSLTSYAPQTDYSEGIRQFVA